MAGRVELRALLERAFPVLEEAAGPVGPTSEAWGRDRRLLATFEAILGDEALRERLLAADADLDPEPLRAALGAPSATPSPAPGPGEECVRAVLKDRVERYFAGLLAPAEEPALRNHLADCAACRRRYGELWQEEELGPEGASRRLRRLIRGLPWGDLVPDEEPEAEPDPEPEPEPKSPPVPEPAPEPESAPVTEEASVEAAARRRVSWVKVGIYAFAGALAVTGALLLVGAEPPAPPPASEEKRSPEAAEGTLALSVFRKDDSGRFDEPWLLASGSVSAGESLLVTYRLEKGQGPYLALLLLDDLGGMRWLLPAGGPARGFGRSVRVPTEGEPLSVAVEAPRSARRLLVCGMATPTPLDLTALGATVTRARAADGFYERPPRLESERSVQSCLPFDVLQ